MLADNLKVSCIRRLNYGDSINPLRLCSLENLSKGKQKSIKGRGEEEEGQ